MSKTELIDQKTVEDDYGIPVHTQNTWRCTNRYGWRDLTIKLGRLIRYRRPDIERWLESRRLAPPISGGEQPWNARNEGTQLKELQERQVMRKTAFRHPDPHEAQEAGVISDEGAP